jgi:hypothetical protein
MITIGVGRMYFVSDRTGVLEFDEDESSVILRNQAFDVIRTDDIRWIRDPTTGARVAGPW